MQQKQKITDKPLFLNRIIIQINIQVQIIEWCGKPNSIRCDNKPEYVSGKLSAGQASTILSWILFNLTIRPYIERYNRTVRYDWHSQHLFEGITAVQDCTIQWFWHYNNERPNKWLGDITPKQELAIAA